MRISQFFLYSKPENLLVGKHLFFVNIENKFIKCFSSQKEKKFKPRSCYYKILNVSTSANADEIKKSYLDLAKRFHPDTKFGDKIQEEKFKEIQEAYKVLINEPERRIYNEENGIESNWKYENIDSSFGDKEKIYKNFSDEKINHEKLNEKIKLDEQFYNYFQSKYFKNEEYFYKHPIENDPFEMTRKLARQKIEIKQKKRDNYDLHNPFTLNAYYTEKSENNNDDPNNMNYVKNGDLIKDFKIPILLGFVLFTGYTIGKGVYEAQEGKTLMEKTKSVEKGSGYTVKILPLNIA